MDNGLDYLGDLFYDENLKQSDSSNEVSSAEQEAFTSEALRRDMIDLIPVIFHGSRNFTQKPYQ